MHRSVPMLVVVGVVLGMAGPPEARAGTNDLWEDLVPMVAVSTGSALLGVGIGTYVESTMQRDAGDGLTDQLKSSKLEAAADDTRNDALLYLGAGAVTVGAGLVWMWLLDDHPTDGESARSVAPAVAPGYLGLQGTF